MATIERITQEYVEKQKRNGDGRNQLLILKEGLGRYIQQYESVAKRFNDLNADYKELKKKQEEPYAPASPQYSSSPQYSGEEEKQDFPQNVVVEQKALCAIDKALLRSKLRKEAKLALLDTTSNYKKKLIEEKDEKKRCFELNKVLQRKNDRLEVALEMATLPKAVCPTGQPVTVTVNANPEVIKTSRSITIFSDGTVMLNTKLELLTEVATKFWKVLDDAPLFTAKVKSGVISPITESLTRTVETSAIYIIIQDNISILFYFNPIFLERLNLCFSLRISRFFIRYSLSFACISS